MIRWIIYMGSQFLRKYGFLCGLILMADILDCMSAILAKLVNGDDKLSFSLWRYPTHYLVLLLGVLLDLIQYYFVLYTPLEDYAPALEEPIQFVYFLGLYIMVSIALSIIGNISRCGVAIPGFLERLLSASKNKLDQDGKA